ncbi:MAG: COR domain-containing protein [Chitinophagales bacterium]
MNTIVNPRRKLKLDRSKQNLTDRDLPEIWRKVKANQIEFVDLSYNEGRIESMVLSADYLQSVRYLYLYQSNIQSIRIEDDLPNLRILHLGKNQLKSFWLPKGFANLQHLRLEENQLKEFELADFEGLKAMKGLYLRKNDVSNIDQNILSQAENCWKQVKKYYTALKNTGEGLNNEVKVILVGNGSVGKTQVAKRLEGHPDYVFNDQHDSTHAIVLLRKHLEVYDLEKGLMLNIWDFGGQDIYHATHRLFMQTQALFLLVWDIVNESKSHHEYKNKLYENQDLPYWLEYVRCFGKGSPVLVVENKMDKTEAEIETELEGKKPVEVDRQELKKNHTHIEDFLKVSAKRDKGFAALEYKIEGIYADDPKLLEALKKRLLPNGWLQVRDRVRAEQEKKGGAKTIEMETFRQWCEAAEVASSSDVLLRFLHDTGVLFYRSQYFRGNIILDQSWAIEAVYKVFDKEERHHEILEEEKGELDHRLLTRIWRRHTDEERALFMDFMLSCELCFEVTEKDEKRKYHSPSFKERKFVVPQYLTAQMPEEDRKAYIAVLQLEECRRIGYRFLPPVFMHRFLVKTKDIKFVHERYQQGVLLEYEEVHVLVTADFQQHCIEIRFPKSEKAQQLAAELENLLAHIEEETLFQTVRKKEGEEEFSVLKRVSLFKQLAQQEKNPSQTAYQKPKATRLFVSAAMEDAKWKKQLTTHLNILERVDSVKVWSEDKILTGSQREAVIQQQMKEADIILLLISSDYLGGDKQYHQEMQQAMEYSQKGEAIVVPISLRSCTWDETAFAGLQILPKSQKPIDLAENTDAALSEVTAELRTLLNQQSNVK